MERRALRELGTIGLVSGVLLVVVNLLHPVGDTETYADGVKFAMKTDTFWVILHLLIALGFLPLPWVLRGWVATLEPGRARVLGDFAVMLIVMGTALGSIHLAGIDGVALPAIGTALRTTGQTPELVGAATALMKVHLTTFVFGSRCACAGASP